MELKDGKEQIFIKCEFEPLIIKFFGELVKRNFDILNFELLNKFNSKSTNKYALNLFFLINSIFNGSNQIYKISNERFFNAFTGNKDITNRTKRNILYEVKNKTRTDYNFIMQHETKGVYLEKIERMDDEYIELFLIRFMDLLNNK